MMIKNKSENKVTKEDAQPSAFGRFLLFIFGTMLFSIVLEVIGILFIYPEEGARHCIEVYLQEQRWMQRDYDKSVVLLGGISPYHLISIFSDWLNAAVFNLASTSNGEPRFGDEGVGMLGLFDDLVISLPVVVCITLFRAMILILSTPVYALAFYVGLTYGVTRRELRKYNVGRERNRVHYMAKSFIAPSLVWPWFVYLSIPMAVHPAAVIVPTALVMALAVRLASEFFEKVF